MAGRVWGTPIHNQGHTLLRVEGARFDDTTTPCDVEVTGKKRPLGCFWPARATVVNPEDGAVLELPGTLSTFQEYGDRGDSGYVFVPLPGQDATRAVKRGRRVEAVRS